MSACVEKHLRDRYKSMQLDVTDAAELDRDAFVSTYLAQNRPVLIKVKDLKSVCIAMGA